MMLSGPAMPRRMRTPSPLLSWVLARKWQLVFETCRLCQSKWRSANTATCWTSRGCLNKFVRPRLFWCLRQALQINHYWPTRARVYLESLNVHVFYPHERTSLLASDWVPPTLFQNSAVHIGKVLSTVRTICAPKIPQVFRHRVFQNMHFAPKTHDFDDFPYVGTFPNVTKIISFKVV